MNQPGLPSFAPRKSTLPPPAKTQSPNQVLGGNRWILTFCFFFSRAGVRKQRAKQGCPKSSRGRTGVFQIFFVLTSTMKYSLNKKIPNKNQSPLRLPPGNQPKIQIYERISFAKSWLLINDPCNDLGKLRHYNSAT